MTDTTTYTATLTITSVDDSEDIRVNVDSEPSAVERVTEGRGLPAAYSAMRDVQRFLHMTSRRESFNMDDREFFNLPACEQMRAIKQAADEAACSVVVERTSLLDV